MIQGCEADADDRCVGLWSQLRRAFAVEPPVSAVPKRTPRPVGAAPRSIPQPPPVQRIDVKAFLESRLTEGLKAVEHDVPVSEWTPAFRDLLDALTNEPAGHVRQMPAAAQRALSMCADEDVPNHVVVALFERDPVLTEALLTRANSAYYNLSGRPCLSLSEAIVRQGRRSAHSVVLQQTLAGMVCRPGGIWTDMATKVWTHMVRTSPIARSLAPAFDVDPEQAMTLGLLHDIGKLVVFDRVSALRTATRREPELRKGAVSRLLRVLHEPLGGICALHWNLGDDSALAIATHHRDSLPAVPDALSEVLWLAERWDLAAWRFAPVKLSDLWAEGRLTGRVPDVINALKPLGGAAEPSLSR